MGQNENNLYLSAKKTLAFFDLFDFPLTLIELRQGLDMAASFEELEQILKTSLPGIESREGFFFLSGRSEIVEKRLRNYNLFNQKLALAKKAARALRYLPGVQLAAACNNFSYKPESDIDFFIVTAKNRLWQTRFFATALLWALGRWRHGEKIQDRICLSFFVSEEALDLESLMLFKRCENFQDIPCDGEEIGKLLGDTSPQPPSMRGRRDIYFIHWLLDLLPFYDSGKSFENFWEKNAWLKKYLPNSCRPELAPRFRVSDNFLSRGVKALASVFDSVLGNSLEKFLKKLQLWKMKRPLADPGNLSDTRVVISDRVLKFHEGDRREEYWEKWASNTRKYQ